MGRAERFTPGFVTDLTVACDYYDAISSLNGDNFRKQVDDRLDLILQAPEGYAVVYESVRAVRVRSFPYVILYEVFPEHIDFIALVHGAGSRENWFDHISRPR